MCGYVAHGALVFGEWAVVEIFYKHPSNTSSCATTETKLYRELFKCYQEIAFIISDGITAAINIIVHYAIWFVVPAMLMCRS